MCNLEERLSNVLTAVHMMILLCGALSPPQDFAGGLASCVYKIGDQNNSGKFLIRNTMTTSKFPAETKGKYFWWTM